MINTQQPQTLIKNGVRFTLESFSFIMLVNFTNNSEIANSNNACLIQNLEKSFFTVYILILYRLLFSRVSVSSQWAHAPHLGWGGIAPFCHEGLHPPAHPSPVQLRAAPFPLSPGPPVPPVCLLHPVSHPVPRTGSHGPLRDPGPAPLLPVAWPGRSSARLPNAPQQPAVLQQHLPPDPLQLAL